MNSLNMRRIAVISQLIILTLASCQFSDDGLKTLNTAINQKWHENIRLVDLTTKQVEESGNRPLDVEVLDDSKSILELRRKFDMPETADSLDQQLNIESAIEYGFKLSEFIKQKEISVDQEFEKTIAGLATENLNEELKKRLIFLNVLNFESQIFEDRLRTIGVNCGFCYSFNLFSEKDSVQLGSIHESIVSIADQTNDFQNFSFENIQVSLNDKIIETEFVAIGCSIYMKFPVREPGKYIYTGDLRIKYEGVEYEYLCGFRFEIMGLTK